MEQETRRKCFPVVAFSPRTMKGVRLMEAVDIRRVPDAHKHMVTEVECRNGAVVRLRDDYYLTMVCLPVTGVSYYPPGTDEMRQKRLSVLEAAYDMLRYSLPG